MTGCEDGDCSSSNERSYSCFIDWMSLQKADLDELTESLNPQSDEQGTSENEERYRELSSKTIEHFENYMSKRAWLARDDTSPFFAPSWCTTLENPLLWIAGCRPSMFIRLLYALCGSEMEHHLAEFLRGETHGTLGHLSADQLSSVDKLQLKILREEEKLTSKLASLQEEIADQPLASIAKAASQIGETDKNAEKALDEHEQSMANILEEADKMLLNSLKELLSILTPKQGIDFLTASKKLHLSIHEWGKKRDQKHGRNQKLFNKIGKQAFVFATRL